MTRLNGIDWDTFERDFDKRFNSMWRFGKAGAVVAILFYLTVIGAIIAACIHFF